MPFQDIFRDPPTAYRLLPFWFWNGEMEEAEIVRQIQEMAEKGLGGFFLCARQGLAISYLSEEWFQRVAVAVEAAQKCGLEVWLYDEYPYPSGMSGGEVTLQHPEAKQRQLLHSSEIVSGPQTFSYELPWGRVLFAQAIPLEDANEANRKAIDLTASIGIVQPESVFQATGLTSYTNKRFFSASLGKRLAWNVPPGRWQIRIFQDKEIDGFKYFGTYVDPCHKAAIETFLATTHEQYARRFASHFGQTIKGMFTDEVGLLGRIPWSPQLPAFFRARYSEELIEKLPDLLYPQGEQTAQLRYRYFQSIHRLLNETYHQPSSAWCQRNNLHYVTEVPSVRMTTQYYSHVPGGDSAHEKIGRSLEWILERNRYNMRSDPKIASSLAHQLGSERSMIECFHSVGWSMTLQDAKWMLDRLAAFGINLFVFHAFYYTISGLRKHDAPPSQFLQNPYWPYFRQLADYTARLSYALSQGKADVSIAVIHPATSFWTQMGNPFHQFNYSGQDKAEEQRLERLKSDWFALRKQLLLQQIDFDHLDPELLAEATIVDGRLAIGQAYYEVLILPPLTNLEAGAWARIQEFGRAGGKVIGVGLLPYERIEQESPDETELLEWFGLQSSPRARYWGEPEQAGASTHSENEATKRPWTKGRQNAYFIAGQGEQAAEALLALLAQCAPSAVHLEAIEGAQTSFLTHARSLPDGSHLLFITHQEGTEKVLRLRLSKRPAGQKIERLDLLSGQRQPIAVERSEQGWDAHVAFAPYESYLLYYSDQESGQVEDDTAAIVAEERPWPLVLDITQPWQLSAQRGNILRLGTFHFALDRDGTGPEQHWHEGEAGESWPEVEVKPFINQCASIANEQTFPVQFKQTFGLAVSSTLAYPVHGWYQSSFYVAELPASCGLLMDGDAISGDYTLYCNGRKITARDFVPTTQYGHPQLTCDISPFLKQGHNTLVAHVEVKRDEDGIRDPLYLSGPFGVFLQAEGTPTLARVPATGSPHSGMQEGYPYYAGTLSFKREIVLETLPREKTFSLQIQGWDAALHDCVEVLANGHSLGICCWSPYRWEGKSNILRVGTNTFEIRVTNTLNGMLEGTYFDEQTHRIVPIHETGNRQ